MNYFTSKPKKPIRAEPRIIACRLDSKARLVLPLIIREKLSVSKGETILFEISFAKSQALLKASKNPETGLKRTSRNGWEK